MFLIVITHTDVLSTNSEVHLWSVSIQNFTCWHWKCRKKSHEWQGMDDQFSRPTHSLYWYSLLQLLWSILTISGCL